MFDFITQPIMAWFGIPSATILLLIIILIVILIKD